MLHKLFLTLIFISCISSFGCQGSSEFPRTLLHVDNNIELSLVSEKSEYNAKNVSSGSVKFYATIKNHGDKPIVIAHPTICRPEQYQMNERFYFREGHGKSEILLRVKKPDGEVIILRDGPFYFDPKMIDHFVIVPNHSIQFELGWFFPNARGRWENDERAFNLFLKKGKYKIMLLYRNFFPKAVIYDVKMKKASFTEVWTGEILSNEIMATIK